MQNKQTHVFFSLTAYLYVMSKNFAVVTTKVAG